MHRGVEHVRACVGFVVPAAARTSRPRPGQCAGLISPFRWASASSSGKRVRPVEYRGLRRCQSPTSDTSSKSPGCHISAEALCSKLVPGGAQGRRAFGPGNQLCCSLVSREEPMPPCFLLGFAAGLPVWAVHLLAQFPARVLIVACSAGRERPTRLPIGPAAFEHRGLAHGGRGAYARCLQAMWQSNRGNQSGQALHHQSITRSGSCGGAARCAALT